MNGGNRQAEVHYINTGFPYTVTESFMDLFEGLSYVDADIAFAEALHDQESTYWSMNNNLYKYELSGPVSTSYFSHGHVYEVNGHVPRLDEGRRERTWDDDPLVIWQDNIDPDSMTYEELLDLGEAVGSQSRGLPQERISLLPISKHKSSFFSRKKTRSERCIICQMEYKRGDRQMTLPCKHAYHASCITRWLNLNKDEISMNKPWKGE
ncbi:E3 ubiquitin ligase BIG BROTHER [Acorus calamus]|uniref:E3 ubiquitin ligase BIG BROTHER n=1 Tax=Acorus calamus TaxID=4465 RepID=A0AAV9CKQ6_ACOCL|nr:E3 ubiquitin ligase BIG BROTHER [Acorus calamus]